METDPSPPFRHQLYAGITVSNHYKLINKVSETYFIKQLISILEEKEIVKNKTLKLSMKGRRGFSKRDSRVSSLERIERH